MNRKNAKRNALVTSIISLLLCVSMLVGTTFAWFTDEVVSGRNTIAAGNLDVELMANGNKVDSETVLFGKVELWEPGVVAYENLQVKNVGTLALKYQLTLGAFKENATEAGNKLSEVVKIAVIDKVAENATRAEVLAAAKASEKVGTLADFIWADTLEAGAETAEKAIVVFWEPGENDNLYNMNNGQKTTDEKPLFIEFSVNLYATQKMSEEDSFGDDYDEMAAVATTDEELKAAIENPVVAVITIDGDLVYDWGGDSYENSKALLMKGKTLKGYDGNDSITFKGYGSANPITDVALYDITVKDETVGDNEGSWEHGHLEFVNLKAVNVTFANSIMVGGNSTLTGCSMDNAVDSWYGLWIESGNTVIEDCTFTGTRAIKIHEAYGEEVESVVINNNKFVDLTEKPGVVIGGLNADTTVSITNNTFAGTQAGDQGNYKYETDTDLTTIDFTDADNIVAGYADTNAELKAAIDAGETTIVVGAGNYSFPASSLNESVTLICDEDTVFEGAKLNANGATVIGATFQNTATSNTVNGIYKDCTFEGSNGLRYGYAGETVVFENCTFSGDLYGAHFDGGANEVLFKNCTLSGFNAMGSAITKLTMEGCTFVANGKSNYNGINLWGNTDMTGCTFVFDGTAGTEWVDLCSSNKTVTFTNCVVTDGANETAIKDVVGNYGDGNTIIIDGVTTDIPNMN